MVRMGPDGRSDTSGARIQDPLLFLPGVGKAAHHLLADAEGLSRHDIKLQLNYSVKLPSPRSFVNIRAETLHLIYASGFFS